MSWEAVDDWPGAAREGGAFRAGAEPILAERGSPTGLERLARCFGGSRVRHLPPPARRAVLSAAYVYVERLDGSRWRVPRARLHGAPLVHGRRVIGVEEGEDLVLAHRADCPLEGALLAQLGEAAEDAWEGARLRAVGVGVGLALGGLAVMRLVTSLPRAVHALRGGNLDGSVLEAGGGLFLAALALASLLFVPEWLRVDRRGVLLRRGAIPWLSFFLPREAFSRARVQKRIAGNKKNRETRWRVELVLAAPQRFGGLVAIDALEVAELYSGQLEEAQELARTIAELLAVEVDSSARTPAAGGGA